MATWPGLLVQGNIDLLHRPIVTNADGSISTVLSITVESGGYEVIIPTILATPARHVTNAEAIAHYVSSGEHLGKFDTVANAEVYAIALHQQQDLYYRTPNPADPPAYILTYPPNYLTTASPAAITTAASSGNGLSCSLFGNATTSWLADDVVIAIVFIRAISSFGSGAVNQTTDPGPYTSMTIGGLAMNRISSVATSSGLSVRGELWWLHMTSAGSGKLLGTHSDTTASSGPEGTFLTIHGSPVPSSPFETQRTNYITGSTSTLVIPGISTQALGSIVYFSGAARGVGAHMANGSDDVIGITGPYSSNTFQGGQYDWASLPIPAQNTGNLTWPVGSGGPVSGVGFCFALLNSVQFTADTSSGGPIRPLRPKATVLGLLGADLYKRKS